MNQILFSKKCIEDYEFESFKHSELIPFRIEGKLKNEENLDIMPKLIKNQSAPQNYFKKAINMTVDLVKQSEKEEGTS